MPKQYHDEDVFSAARRRIVEQMRAGHRIFVCFSGGKDSSVVLYLCLEAAAECGYGDIDVGFEDGEVMDLEVVEHAAYVAGLDGVKFHWFLSCFPVPNCGSRFMPFIWAWDPRERDRWYRTLPDEYICTRQWARYNFNTRRFPPPAGRKLILTQGLRTDESPMRYAGRVRTKSALNSSPSGGGGYAFCPIYDWHWRDVWRYLSGKRYAAVYDTYARLGLPGNLPRVSVVTAAEHAELLHARRDVDAAFIAMVNRRCPGIAWVAQHGRKALSPKPAPGQSWRELCEWLIEQPAPDWYRDRISKQYAFIMDNHAKHSALPFPEGKCKQCQVEVKIDSWPSLARAMYTGDPWSRAIVGGFPELDFAALLPMPDYTELAA